MFCSRCGAGLPPGASYCSGCGTRTTTVTVPVVLKRPGLVTLLAVLQFIGGGFLALLFVGLMVMLATSGENVGALSVALTTILGVFAVTYIACGVGLWRLKNWARLLLIGLSILGLLNLPIGTVISVLILIYMFKPGIKVLFSGREAHELTPDESRAVGEVTNSSGAVVATVVVAVVLGGVMLVGIVAAIAVPGLLRARMAGNEAIAIGRAREYLSAQTSYAQTLNGGYFTRAECLTEPRLCAPAYQGTSFLDWSPTVPASGYTFLHIDIPADEVGPDAQNKMRDFVFWAYPTTHGSTGVRTFCLDGSGVIRMTSQEVSAMEKLNGCPASWPPIYER